MGCRPQGTWTLRRAMRWNASIVIELTDLGAQELHDATGIEQPSLAVGTVNIETEADTYEEAVAQALHQAAALMEHRTHEN